MKRVALLSMAAILVLLLVTTSAHAHVGFATGLGPRLSNPLTPHVGRVYWTPGERAAQRAMSQGSAELSQIDADLKRDVRKIKCAKLHAQYVGRHGLTTPTPLKGYSGCAKYARDEAYWQTQRGERYTVTSAFNQAAYTVHNTAFGW